MMLSGKRSAWVVDSNTLPGPLQESQAVTTPSRVYLLGGYSNGGVLDSIYSAPINAAGIIGTWVTETNKLPGTARLSRAITTSTMVYLMGGLDASNKASNLIYGATANGGTLGAWVTQAIRLPISVHSFQAIATADRVYLIGGTPASGPASNAVYSAPISAAGIMGTWRKENDTLPTAIIRSQAIKTSSRVYLLGGFTNTVTDAVYSVRLDRL